MAKKRRRSMAGASNRNRSKRKSGKKWLTLPTGFQLFREKEGTTMKLDILPFIVENVKNHPDKADIPDDIWWKLPYKMHRNVGPDKASVICPGTFGKGCPICEERTDIYDDKNRDDDEAKGLKASNRCLYVVRPAEGKHEGDTLIWDISDYCFLQTLDEELDNGDEEWSSFADLENGYTLKIRFKEEAIGKSTFARANRIDFIERDDISDEDLESYPDITNCIKALSYDQVSTIFHEGISDDSTDSKDEDESESKKTTRKKAVSKKRSTKKKEPEPVELEWTDLIEMDEYELLEVSEAEALGIEDGDYANETELRDQIAEMLDIEKPKESAADKKKAAAKKKKEAAAKKKKIAAAKKKAASKKKEPEEGVCPFDHDFGSDFEETPDCDEDKCDQYDSCFDEFDKE